jgi:hypothetical protein
VGGGGGGAGGGQPLLGPQHADAFVSKAPILSRRKQQGRPRDAKSVVGCRGMELYFALQKTTQKTPPSGYIFGRFLSNTFNGRDLDDVTSLTFAQQRPLSLPFLNMSMDETVLSAVRAAMMSAKVPSAFEKVYKVRLCVWLGDRPPHEKRNKPPPPFFLCRLQISGFKRTYPRAELARTPYFRRRRHGAVVPPRAAPLSRLFDVIHFPTSNDDNTTTEREEKVLHPNFSVFPPLTRQKTLFTHPPRIQDECVFSFDTPLSPGGLYVNLASFHGRVGTFHNVIVVRQNTSN